MRVSWSALHPSTRPIPCSRPPALMSSRCLSWYDWKESLNSNRIFEQCSHFPEFQCICHVARRARCEAPTPHCAASVSDGVSKEPSHPSWHRQPRARGRTSRGCLHSGLLPGPCISISFMTMFAFLALDFAGWTR